MRFASLVVGATLVAGAALAAPERVDLGSAPPPPPSTSTVQPVPAAAVPPPAQAVTTEAVSTKPKSKRADKLAEQKMLAAIKPEPNEFTNDPVLGNASRIRGQEVTGLVTFTFDDGPSAEITPTVLDALKKYDVPATFFIVTRRLAGKSGEKPRELLARTIAEGHVVASHSVSHAYLGNASATKLTREVDKSFEALAAHAKRPIGMFRAPYGALGAAGRARLKKLGVTEVFWSIDTLDWQAKKPEKLRAKVMSMILKQNGGVVLMHDVKPITGQVIADVLDDLEAENCRRLAAKQEPIWPVSIHYFLRDGNEPRAVPDEVVKRTAAYKRAFPERCAKRAGGQPAPAAATPASPQPTTPATPAATTSPAAPVAPIAPAKP